MALDPRLSDAFRTNPARAAAVQGVPSTPASATEWPHAPVEPRATLRPVDPATGVYRQPGASAAPSAPPAPQPSAPLRTVQPPGLARNAYDYAVGRPPVGPQPKVGALKNTWNAATRGTGYAAPLLGAANAAIQEAPKVADSLRDANQTGLDNATQIAESTAKVAARGAGAGIGAKLGAGAGATLGALGGPLAPVTVPVGGLVGGLAGAWAGDRLADTGVDAAISTGREALGVVPKPTLKQPSMPAAQPPTVTSGPPLTDAQKQAAILDTVNARQAAGLPQANSFQEKALAYKPQEPTTVQTRNGGSVMTVPAGSHVSEFGTVTALPLTQEQQAGVDARIKAQGGGQDEYGNYLTPQAMAYRKERLAGGGLRQPMATEPVIIGDGGGYGLLSKEYQEQRNASDALQMLPGESRSTYATRVGAMSQRRGQDIDQGNNVRTNDTSRRGQDITQSTTLRGQDMDLQGRILPKQMEMQYNAQMRGLRAQVWQQAGGDASKAAQLWASRGGDAKDFLDMAKQQQDLGDKATEAADKQFEHQAVETNDKGETVVSKGKEAIARNVRQNIAPDYDQMSPEQRASLRPRLEAATNIVNGMNARKDTSWIDNWLDGPNPALTTLPDLRGAELGTAGLWDGLYNRQVESGDRKITLRDGTVRFIPRGQFNENEFDLFNKSR